MYAIVTTGGKQYKVATDDVLTVEKIEGEAGTKVELPVIFLNDGKKIVTDPAKLAKAKVTAEIVDQFKGEKQLVYKFKKRKRYHKLQGHRQQLTKLKITKVQATSRAKKAAVAEDAAAPAAEENPFRTVESRYQTWHTKKVLVPPVTDAIPAVSVSAPSVSTVSS